MIFDESVGKRWTNMTAAERAVSDVNTGHVLWDGAAVNTQAPGVLGPMLVLTVGASPHRSPGDLDFGTAAFGPDISEVAMTGQLVQAIDAADIPGPATTDGCSAYSNASGVHAPHRARRPRRLPLRREGGQRYDPPAPSLSWWWTT